MADLAKNKIPTAITRRTKLDLSFDHFTTQRFMEMQVVGYRHLIQGESINIEAIGTLRAAPMAVPTYGKMRANLRAFWVPYSLVFKQWSRFYTDTIGYDVNNAGLVAGVPYFDTDTLKQLFSLEPISWWGPTVQLATPGQIEDGVIDIYVGGSPCVLTELGARMVKVLHSLGYRFNLTSKKNVKFNALALLAYLRCFVDWYANQNYLDSSFITEVEKCLSYVDPNIPQKLNRVQLELILFHAPVVCYDDNAYFNSAYDSPSSPNPGLSSQFIFDDITNRGPSPNLVHTMHDGTPIMVQDENTHVAIGTQYIHDALKMLTDYQKRHQLASALPISRWLAQFGAVPRRETLNRSVYIGCKSFDIESGAVYSTASPENGLGDYAAKGGAHGSANWQFTADEYGILLFVSTIQPSAGFWQGCDRHNYSFDKFDFFVPEADGLSVQAIYPSEVYVPKANITSIDELDDHVFGYVGRYAHYKRPINFVTGSFEIPSQMLGGDSWHMQRVFTDESFANNATHIVHSLQFTRGIDSSQYHRVFNYQYADVDPFFSQYHFNITSYAPCRPMMETYEFEDNGERVTVDNGAIVN